MSSKEKRIILIKKILDSFFPSPKIPLNYKNPFTMLIATILSAQTQDKSVNKITKDLFKKAITPEQMLKLSQKELAKIITSLGLAPTKSKNILKLSKIIIEKFKGKVPDTFKKLESLPGVGHKTASVVIGACFKKPAFPVDTHIFRCAKRWGLTDKKSTISKTEKDLKKYFPKNRWFKAHLQIIYFGRTLCMAKNHDKKSCPLCSKLTSS
jgi:endonuclease III